MKISLIGYMGSGKTTIGKALAAHYQVPLFDLDVLIEKDAGDSVYNIITKKGELYFRKLERSILEETLKQESFILATGGGTPCYYDNMDLINQKSRSIYLNITVPQLYAILIDKKQERPLIAHVADEELKEFIAKHLFERRVFYEKAHHLVKPNGLSATQQIKLIEEVLND